MISEDYETVPGALIVTNDTIEVGATDLDGFFQIEIPLTVQRISFDLVGIERAVIELADNCNEIEVVMMLSGTYDFMTPKKVDKLRLKRFKKLPEIHRKAFEKGILKTDKACYIHEFIADNRKK